jgi:aminoglycoside phosphotransferase (APT) family kinase protein
MAAPPNSFDVGARYNFSEKCASPSSSDIQKYVTWALAKVALVNCVRVLAGGIHNNRFTEVTVDGEVRRFVVRMAPVSRSPKSIKRMVRPYDIESEFRALQDLTSTPVRTPKVWGLDLESRFLGRPCFLMEYLGGPTVLEAIEFDPTVILEYVETIRLMNDVQPSQLPSISTLNVKWPDFTEILTSTQLHDSSPPDLLCRAIEVSTITRPLHLPAPTFTNGDLGPANFIVCDDGRIGVVDWELVGYSDPLAELMLLHWWPAEQPFLSRYPIDRLYCERCGYDTTLLPWYRLNSAIYGWLQAAMQGCEEIKRSRETVIQQCLTKR